MGLHRSSCEDTEWYSSWFRFWRGSKPKPSAPWRSAIGQRRAQVEDSTASTALPCKATRGDAVASCAPGAPMPREPHDVPVLQQQGASRAARGPSGRLNGREESKA